MKRLLLLAAWLCVCVIPAFAQNGSIQGRIFDTDGFTMPGATIYLSELPGKGTHSDVTGRYTLVNVPAGRYNLHVSYIGYATVSVSVEVRSGITLTQDVRLEQTATVGNEVIILGDGLRGQARALNQQRNNMNVSNVVSSDQVGRFPDANIGDALKRIPGITIQNDQGEARNLIVRGLAPQLNSVTLNGERIPSAEGDNRMVQLDLIPSDMIQGIEVNKAVLPDMDADAIGGSVNLITRSTPNELRLSGTLGSGLNMLSDRPIWNGSFVVGDRFAHGRLGAIFSISYHNHDFGSDNIESAWIELEDGTAAIDEFDIRKYVVRRERKSTSLKLDYKLDDRNMIYASGMYNWRDDWENRFRMRVSKMADAFDDGEAVQTSDGVYHLPGRVEFQTKGGIDNDRVKGTRLEDQRNRNVTLGGDHLWGIVKFNWSGTYAKASETRPDERYISFRSGGQDVMLDVSDPYKPLALLQNMDDSFKLKLNALSEQQSYTSDEDFNWRADATIPYSHSGFVKVGMRLRDKKKERDNSFTDYDPINGAAFANLGTVPYSDQTDSGFLPGSKYRAGNFATKRFLGGLDLRNPALFEGEDNLEEFIAGNYKANETVLAWYAMADHQFNDKLSAIAGLRLEKTSVEYTGNLFDVDEETFSTTEGSNDYINFFPSLHLRYAAAENTILRFAWTNTMARPSYYDLVPYAEYIAEDSELSRGNPNLKPTTSMNFDLMAEQYFSNVGILSAGAFYKDVNDFIYTKTTRNYTDADFGSGLEFTTALNGGTAEIYGFEVALQRQLWKGLGIYLNYTRTESKTTGVEGRENEELALPGTAKNMFNGSLSYENKRLTLRASLNYSSDYIDELDNDAFSDRYYDRQTFVDLNGSFAITPQLRFFAEVNNLTNQPLRYYQGIRSRTMQEEFYNSRINFGVKFDL